MSTPQSILIVDDEPTIRIAMQFVLEDEGYEVETVEDGAAAVERVSAQSFDLVIMDIRMPRMDGITALKAMRESGATFPVIIASSHGTQDLTIDAIAACASGFLTKPLQPNDVRLAAKRALSREGKRSEGPFERALWAISSGNLQDAAELIRATEMNTHEKALNLAIQAAQKHLSSSQLPRDLFKRISYTA